MSRMDETGESPDIKIIKIIIINNHHELSPYQFYKYY